ncbi:hypothetical protein [Nocardia alni]|uniref:hypothetical protein n=1 Tax=Nocardia alni TaxID=2815723 RepID=UPI001C22DE49|nr:hypothetical protein [Nocardia alni]
MHATNPTTGEREWLPGAFVTDVEGKLVQRGAPQLAVSMDNADVDRLATALQEEAAARGVQVEFEKIDVAWVDSHGSKDAAQEELQKILDSGGGLGKIIIGNKILSRGVDITPTKQAKAIGETMTERGDDTTAFTDAKPIGGLQVRIDGGPAYSDRVNHQVETRAARSGDPERGRDDGGTPGSAVHFISPEDYRSNAPDARVTTIITKYQNAATEHRDAVQAYEHDQNQDNATHVQQTKDDLTAAEHDMRTQATPMQKAAIEQQILNARHTGNDEYDAHAPPLDNDTQRPTSPPPRSTETSFENREAPTLAETDSRTSPAITPTRVAQSHESTTSRRASITDGSTRLDTSHPATDDQAINDCAQQVLQRIADESPDNHDITPPPSTIGLHGMDAMDFQTRSAGTLQTFSGYQAIAQQLQRLQAGAKALVVEKYTGPTNKYGIGAHALYLKNTDGTHISVWDPSTKREYPLDSHHPANLAGVTAVLYDPRGQAQIIPGHDTAGAQLIGAARIGSAPAAGSTLAEPMEVADTEHESDWETVSSDSLHATEPLPTEHRSQQQNPPPPNTPRDSPHQQPATRPADNSNDPDLLSGLENHVLHGLYEDHEADPDLLGGPEDDVLHGLFEDDEADPGLLDGPEDDVLHGLYEDHEPDPDLLGGPEDHVLHGLYEEHEADPGLLDTSEDDVLQGLFDTRSHSDADPEDSPIPEAVRDWGRAADGVLGLVHLDPIPDATITGLRAELADAVRDVPDDRARSWLGTDDLVERLENYVTPGWLEERMPYLRSAQGDEIIVRHGGRRYAIRLRVGLVDPVASTLAPDHDPERADERPLLKLEKRSVAAIEARDSGATTNYRSVGIPGLPSWSILKGPVASVKFTPQLVITHNQTSTATSAAGRLMHLVVLRSRENSKAYDFRLDWEYEIRPIPDAETATEPVDDETASSVDDVTASSDDAETASTAASSVDEEPDSAWQQADTAGVVRALIPDHMASSDVPQVDPADPATQPVDSLDDFPLNSIDGIVDPARLLREVRSEFGTELKGLSDSSEKVLEKFLDEKSQRSHNRLMRAGGYVSPTLFDASGEAIGVLQVTAVVDRFTPRHTSAKVMMENYLLRGVRTEGSLSVANGVDVGAQVEVDFTADTAPHHPDTEHSLNGKVQFHYDANKVNTRTLGSGGTASVAHSLKSAAPHFLSTADLRYVVTLVRPGKADKVRDLGTWQDAARVRVHSKATAGGISNPSPRYVPPEVRELRYLGMSATTDKITGTDVLFERARSWLAANGYLPSGTERPGAAASAAQLDNYRRLAVMRSQLGLGSRMDEAVDGGSSEWFDKPTSFGVERVELRLGALRGAAEPTFRKTVENVQIINWTNSTMSGSEELREEWVHTGGVAGSVGGPLKLGQLQGSIAPLDLAGDHTSGRTKTVDNGLTYEQALLSAGAQRMDVFEVPLRFTLDLHTVSSDVPAVRFARKSLSADEGRAGARPWDAGHMDVWIPEQRTTGVDPGPATAAPAPGARLANAADLRRLRAIRHKIPHSAVVDVMSGSGALTSAFRDVIAGRYDDLPAGMRTPVLAPAAGAGRGWLWRTAHGQDPNHAGSGIQQFGRGAFAPAKLIGNGQQVLDGKYVVEHLATSGILTDTNATVELEAYLGEPTLLTNETFQASDHGGFPGYIETDVYAPDGTALSKDSSAGWQGGISGQLGWQFGKSSTPSDSNELGGKGAAAATQSESTALSYRNRFTYGKQTGTTTSDATGTQVNRVSAEDDRMFRFGADLHYVLTVKRGTRNAVSNLFGVGAYKDVRILVTVPRGGQFILTGHQVRDYAAVLGPDAARLAGTPGALPPVGTARWLPERVRAGDGLGPSAATGIAASHRAAFGEQIERTVLGQTPGVFTPGHSAYVPGLEARLADYASPVGMRGLVARGARGRQVLHYAYQHAGGAELVEVEMQAVPDVDRLDAVIGHDLSTNPGADNGVENYAAHGAGNITHTTTRTGTKADTSTVSVDYPGSSGTNIAAALSTQRDTREEIGLTMEDRTAVRAGQATAFDMPYTFGVRVRKSPMDGVLLNKLNQVGPGIVRLTYETVRDLLAGAPQTSGETKSLVTVRFPTAETTEATELATDPSEPAVAPDARPRYAPAPPLPDRLAPAVLSEDPTAPGWRPGHILLDMTRGGAQVRQRPDPVGFTLGHDFAVYTYSGIDQLHSAMNEVAPKLFTTGSRLWNSEENATQQLTEMIRRGAATLRNDRGEFGLTSGRADADGITVTAKLSGIRLLNTGGVHVDRMRNSTTTISAGGATSTTPDLSFNQDAHNDVGASVTLLERGRTGHGRNAIATANRRDVLKNENGPRSSSLEARADLVLEVTGPTGARRWVTGTVYLRPGPGRPGPRTAPGHPQRELLRSAHPLPRSRHRPRHPNHRRVTPERRDRSRPAGPGHRPSGNRAPMARPVRSGHPRAGQRDVPGRARRPHRAATGATVTAGQHRHPAHPARCERPARRSRRARA